MEKKPKGRMQRGKEDCEFFKNTQIDRRNFVTILDDPILLLEGDSRDS